MFVTALEASKRHRHRRLTVGGGVVGLTAAFAEVGAITAVAALTSVSWHYLIYGHLGDVQSAVAVGLLTGLLYVLPFLFASEYRVDHFMAGRRGVSRILNVWTYSFFTLAALAFLTKTTGTASRGGLALFFILGGATVLGTDFALRRGIRSMVTHGLVTPRRLLVLGTKADVAYFAGQHSFKDTGIEIAATEVLPDDVSVSRVQAGDSDPIGLVLEMARTRSINDVLILSGDAGRTGFETHLADRFMDLPVAVHLGQLAIAKKFPGLHVARLGQARTLALRSAPLDPYQRMLKRAFDLVAATLGLLLLLPAFLLVAILIRLDSPGPVFFRQRRHGFNQREFSIWKFRSMTTQDDGAHIVQAAKNDPRVTRVGRWLRRFNIDELPQLINVILGHMSLVGPRPHALAHDRYYERVIRNYARRLNVKPGITGWAQVNGFRGLTETEHAMRSRIAHDLYYIDNWSIALDLYIIVMTVLSPKAFRNAH